MRLSLAVVLLFKYFKWDKYQVRDLTPSEFTLYFEEAQNIMRIEAGKKVDISPENKNISGPIKSSKPLEGKAALFAIQTMLPKKEQDKIKEWNSYKDKLGIK